MGESKMDNADNGNIRHTQHTTKTTTQHRKPEPNNKPETMGT
jgi:hypothetical protein